jgi:hypothetical protein
MSTTISVAALLLVFASAGAAPKLPAPSVTIPDTVMAHPLGEKDSLFGPIPWRRSPRAFATWGGPWAQRASLYDERYVTW